MPLGKANESEPLQEFQHEQQDSDSIKSEQEPKQQLELDEPNDVLSMPQEIIEKLKARREKPAESRRLMVDSNDISVDKSQPTTEEKLPHVQSYSYSSDSVFVDRTGFLVEQDDSRLLFVPDALGRNVQKLSLRLLPCAALELTELKKAAETEKVRFKISGIMTKYKNDNYLLLEKATRTYSHGNFGR
jgi:hypothetical protein